MKYLEIEHLKKQNMKSTASTNSKPSIILPRREVRTAIKQSMESDWICASESLLE